MPDRPDPAAAALASIRHCPWKAQLARFAADRHGFGDTDGGFGITYPSDLDEYDREVKGVTIPEGYVLADGFGGDAAGGYEVLVLESLYRQVLIGELERIGLSREAAAVRALESSGGGPPGAT